MNFRPEFIKKDTHGHFDRMPKAPSYESIAEYMTTNVITFNPNQSIYEVIDIMLQKAISGAPVMNDNNELVGILSEKDCLRIIVDKAYNNMPVNQMKVKDLMSPNVETVTLNNDIVDMANKFLSSTFKRFPVVNEQGKLIGQIGRRDILKAVGNIKTTTW